MSLHFYKSKTLFLTNYWWLFKGKYEVNSVLVLWVGCISLRSIVSVALLFLCLLLKDQVTKDSHSLITKSLSLKRNEKRYCVHLSICVHHNQFPFFWWFFLVGCEWLWNSLGFYIETKNSLVSSLFLFSRFNKSSTIWTRNLHLFNFFLKRNTSFWTFSLLFWTVTATDCWLSLSFITVVLLGAIEFKEFVEREGKGEVTLSEIKSKDVEVVFSLVWCCDAVDDG